MGLYGVVSYAVSQRTHEIGIRVALGAGRGNILGLVMQWALLIVSVGLAVGLFTSLGVTRFMASVLFEVDPLDAGTFAGVAIAMVAVVMVASFIPARRATAVDPAKALRHQ